jgi:predicted RecB family endonuclease
MCVAIFHQETAEEYAEKYGYEVYEGGAVEEETPPEEDPEQALQDQDLLDIIDKVKEYSDTDLTNLLGTIVPEVTGSTEKLVVEDLSESMAEYLANPKSFTSKWPARAAVIVKLLRQMGL